jgi:hypothetical protein
MTLNLYHQKNNIMNYAVHTLNKYFNICKSDKALTELAENFKNAANYLQGENIYFPVNDPIRVLKELQDSIKTGLNSWGNNYQDQKKRQEKRLKEVSKAIEKIEERRFKTVSVIFEDPQYNYKTSVNPLSSDDSLKQYFINKSFNVGSYPEENMQKCINVQIS